MMDKKRGLVLIVFSLVLAFAFLVSAIPQTFNINGKLTDSNGVALSGDYNFNFSIYNVATGGSYLWNSGVMAVTTDSNGIYHVILNNVNLNFSEQYFLGIKVGTDAEMTPRLNLTSSPYAYMAQNVSVGGIIFDSNIDAGTRNFTTTGTGFFGWLGSLTSRISNAFIGNLNVNGTFNVTNSSGYPAIYIGSNGNVGIGTTTSGYPLEVTGDIRSTNMYVNNGGIFGEGANNDYRIFMGTDKISFDAGAAERMRIVGSTGYVGIGTTTPSNTLDVRGVINASSDIYFNNGTKVGSGNLSGGGTSGYLSQWASGSTLNNSPIYTSGGNVGIGTATPSVKLEVESGNILVDGGDLRISDVAGATGQLISAYGEGRIYLTGLSGGQSTNYLLHGTRSNNDYTWGFSYTPGTIGAGAGLLMMGQPFKNNESYTHGITTFQTKGIERMRIDASGNVGIGTASPSALLHVNITSASSVNIANNSNSLFFVNGTTGNVGIGATTLGLLNASLQVGNPAGSQSSGIAPLVRLIGSENSQTSKTILRLNRKGDSSVYYPATVDFNVYSFDPSGSPNYGPGTQLDIVLKGSSSWDETPDVTVMSLRDNGYVGIGTTTPSNKLDVRGVINASGDIYFNNGTKVGLGNLSGGGTSGYIPQWSGTSTLNNSVIYQNGSNVGIGTQAPGASLDVRGNASVEDGNFLFFRDTGNANGFSIGLDSNQYAFSIRNIGNPATPLFEINRSSSYVGIGTTTPAGILHIKNNSALSSKLLLLENLGGVNGSSADIDFSTGGATITTARISANRTKEGAYTDLVFSTFDGTSLLTRMIMKSTGEIGIGTTTPSNKLDVRGTINASGDIYFNNGTKVGLGNLSGGGTSGYLAQWSGGATLNNSPIYTSGGNVGIGTTTPQHNLQIGSGTTTNLSLGFKGYQNYASRIRFEAQDGSDRLSIIGSIDVSNTDLDKIIFTEQGNNVMAITGNGRVGIGTVVPENTLHISSSDGSTRFQVENTAADGDSILSLQTDGATNWFMGIDDSDSDKLKFYGAGTDWAPDSAQLTLTTTGYVGIGTTSPSARLQINGTGSPSLLISTPDSGGNNGEFIVTGSNVSIGSPNGVPLYLKTSNANRVTISNVGLVGINTTSPTNLLDVVSGNNAGTAPTASFNGDYITIGDFNSALTFSSGVGIKFFDNGVGHASIKYDPATGKLFFCE